MSMSEDDELFEDVGMFEAAVHAKHVDLELPALDKIVLALDGSNQDETARSCATIISKKAGAEVYQHAGPSEAGQLLDLCTEQQAQLLVLPVPYGRDITELKSDSLGDIVDRLLTQSRCPVLCVRDVMDEDAVRAALADVILPVTVHDQACVPAAAWAYKLLNKDGQLEMLAVPDRDVLEEARKLLGNAIDPLALQKEALDRAVTHDIAGLIAAVQKRGADDDVDVHVEIMTGRPVHVIIEQANERPRLVVVGTPKDRSEPAFHRASDIILGAKGPVLIV